MGSAEREIERQKKLDVLLKDIHSKKDNKIISGIKALKVHGDDTVITPLIDLWNKGVSDAVENELSAFFSDLKSSGAAPTIMEVLKNKSYNAIHLPLLATIWNSSIDYSEYLEDFVHLAIKNDFMVALECLTILENLDGPFEEHHVLESEVMLREFAENYNENKNEEEKKVQMVLEISKLVRSFDERTM